MIYKSSPFVIVKADDARGEVDAIVNSTAGPPDAQGDVVVPGAWSKAIASKRKPSVVWNHQNGLSNPELAIVGKVTSLRELLPGDPSLPIEHQQAGRGALIASMLFNLSTTAGRDAYSNVAGGYVDEWSVGFLPEVHGYNKDGGCNEIRSAFPLFEVSPVLMGASPMTATLSVKSAAPRSRDDELMALAAVLATAN